MRFNKWLASVQKEYMKVRQNPIYKISESICVDNHSINITLGKDIEIAIDDVSCTWRELRPLYSPHKEEFDALLESIIEQNLELAESAQILLQAVGDEMVPDLTLKRLAGESLTNEESSGVLMVKALTEKKLNELGSIFQKIPKVMEGFTLHLTVLDKTMELTYGYGLELNWSNLQWKYNTLNKQIGIVTVDVNDCLALIAHFDEFKAVLEALKTGMKNLAALLKKKD